MKTCIIKTKSNGRVFHNSIMWKDFPHKNFLETCLDIPYVGYIQALEADFFVYEEIQNKNILDNYQIIIFLSNSNEAIPNELKNKKIFIIPCEPVDYYANNDSEKYFIINNYFWENLPKNHISLPYVYDLKTFENFKKNKKENIIFRQRRSEQIKDIDLFSVITEGAILNKSYSAWENSRTLYMENLSRCKYTYSTCNSKSPGQVIAEASILGSVVFSTKNKLLAKLILPEFCFISSVDEVKDKIIILEKDENLYNSLLKEIYDNINTNLSFDRIKEIINEKNYSNNNNK